MHYTYDALNRLDRVAGGREDNPGLLPVNKAGQLRKLRYGNGVQTEYRYGEEGVLSSLVTVTEQGRVLLNFDYAYDGNGNCTTKSGEQYRNEYAYDRMNRLARASYDGKEERYTYDLAGNRLRKESAQGTETYHYNAKNQLTHIQSGTDALRYLYDRQGNLLEEQGKANRKQYSYDTANRQVSVASVEADGIKERFIQTNRFDGEGLRYETEENGKIIRFLFDRGELVQEKQEDEEISYVRGYHPISLNRSGKDRNYFVQDEMGSTLFLLDQDHEIRKTYRYDAFGAVMEETGDLQNRLSYTGQMYDGVTGQYYLRVRFYNPKLGRFMQEDTYRGDGLNLYAYCANNPVMYYDPSGYAQLCTSIKTNSAAEAEGGSGTTKPDYYVTPTGDAIPADRAEFDRNLSLMQDINGKYVGDTSNGPVRVSIEGPHPLDGNFNGNLDSDHFVDHMHIEHRKNGVSGQWGKGWHNKISIPLSWIGGR